MTAFLSKPENANLAWIQYQLANEHGIKREQDELWLTILNDAGRDRFAAEDLIDSIANCKITLSRFAQSIAPVSKPTIREASRVVRGWSNLDLSLFMFTAFAIGMFANEFIRSFL